MKSKLFKGLSPQEKVKQEAYFKEHKAIFVVLQETIKKDLDLITKESQSDKRYDEQSWAYKQADYNGTKRAYEDILELLTIG